MNAVPAVEARQVSKSFSVDGKEVPVLHGASLQIMPGEMVAIMGPSGSGKSTLMYCLAGLDQPTSGQVSLNGTDLASQSRKALAEMRRGELGFVFQSYNLVPTLTAYENVALPYLLSGRKPPKEQLIAVMNEVGLGHRVDAKVPSMSGGEQQRTALARVLAQQPQIVFADEPTGALDSRSGELVMARLAEITRQAGRSVVVVTHDPGVAARCDRVVFLFDGYLVGELRPQSVSQVADVLTELTERARA
ncbi:MAG: ABC transporter ATP-binding protein [Propionibacterium sp.]|uniref:ABC transporter ATP-binding protein n=2 Tax=Arachnia rubra TaxID=1547448 RepID=A0ABX7YA87_9ACTN|nr:ABC transporter ATP-binding protein [Propionibacterium sp.]MBB1576978.1 ABC transporter ATP-binding protein [Propionibacterium sp.]QUC09548.1 ABC transporter ATP-binding protein [Arachnia rubra]